MIDRHQHAQGPTVETGLFRAKRGPSRRRSAHGPPSTETAYDQAPRTECKERHLEHRRVGQATPAVTG